MPGTEIYQERVLGAPDVCNNCLRVIRVERIDPTRDGLAREYEASFERHRQHTQVDHGPAETVSDQKGVFCTHCGTESARDRWWTADSLTREQFKAYLRHLVGTLEHKDIDAKPKELVAAALQHYDDHDDPDGAFQTGVDVAVIAAAAETDDPVTAD